MTIDDVIFYYYVLLDPAYLAFPRCTPCPSRVWKPIARPGMDTVQNLILATGLAYAANDFYTEQYNAYWAAFNAVGVKFAQGDHDCGRLRFRR